MTTAVIVVLVVFFVLRSERIRKRLFKVLKKEYKKRRAVVKGYIGERRVKRMLRDNLQPTAYSLYTDLYVPKQDKKQFSQIDHVVISRFGIFVIETKNFTGEIYAKEKSSKWFYADTQISFQNPIYQNKGHIKTLQDFLGLPAENFHTLVFFISGNQFRLPIPPNVYNRNFLEGIRKEQGAVLGGIQVEDVRASLDELTRTTNKRAVARIHRKNIERERRLAQIQNKARSRN